MVAQERDGTGLSFVVTAGLLTESSRAYVLYCAMISGFDSVHVRSVLPLLQLAAKHGESSGDR